MAKRIQSRVIKSRPLGNSIDAGTSHDFRTRIEGIHTGNSQVKSISNSVIYTRLGTARISKDNEPMGRMLDCYV